MSSDLTARALIRNAALRLFAERGPEAVTIRQIAAAAEVSPALVVHHFGSKDGLRAAVDAYAVDTFDSLFAMGADELPDVLAGKGTASVAELFARALPADSPLPAYLRRLLMTDDPAGAALFARLYAVTETVLASMSQAGMASPSDDPDVRAAFLLANDLALILLRGPIATAIGVDPLTPAGLARWTAEVTRVYTDGAFVVPLDSPTNQE